MSLLAVAWDDEVLAGRAGALAVEFDLPVCGFCADPSTVLLWPNLLILRSVGLQIQVAGSRAPGPVMVDFSSGRMRHRSSGGGELLSRACGIAGGRRPSVLDATAGLGRDAFILANLGCEITLCEREPVVAALLRDGLSRARSCDDAAIVASAKRMDLHSTDALKLLRDATGPLADVIYLDPMFPSGQKSALAKKEMQIFRDLFVDDHPDDNLLDLALVGAKHRVVVKRGLKSSPLNDVEPDFALRGRAVRFDVYTKRKFE
jgi:16S rRNA (guanine1516-N2)-methyltransferase